MKPEDYGACYSCRHWTLRTSDERHGEVLPGEHPHRNSLGDCAVDDDVLRIGCDSCPDYARRETQAERDAAIVQSLHDTSEFYRKHGGPDSDAGQP